MWKRPGVVYGTAGTDQKERGGGGNLVCFMMRLAVW